MEQSKISLFEAIKFGFITTMDNIWLFLGLLFVQILVRMLRYSGILFIFAMHFVRGFSIAQQETLSWEFLVSLISMQVVVISILLYLVFTVLDYAVQAGFRKVMLELYDTGHSSFSSLFTSFSMVLNFAIAQCLYTLMVSLGLVFFVIPGVWAAVTYYFFDYALVDKHMGPIDSLKESARIVDGYRMLVLALLSLIWLAYAFAFHLFGFTLLFAIPLSYGAKVYFYRHLNAKPISQY